LGSGQNRIGSPRRERVGHDDVDEGSRLPPEGLTLDRVGRRREILKEFNDAWRTVDTEAKLNSLDPAVERAYNMVYSKEVHKAFDIAQEPDKVRDAYGRTPVGQGLLLARRLVENGVKAVSIWMGGWDTHSDNFKSLKEKLMAPMDQGRVTVGAGSQ